MFTANRTITLALIVTLILAGEGTAAVIHFEGVVAPNTQNTDDGTNRVFSGFNVFLPHGHYQGVGFLQPTPRPSSGSDWLLHDHFSGTFGQPWVLTQVGGAPFSIQSFQASEWDNSFTRGNVVTVTGALNGGGTISTTFTTDATFGFQTFTFGPGWNNLLSVSFVDLNPDTGFGKIGYDNVVVNADPVVVPEPTSLSLFVLGSLGLATVWARRRRA